MRKANYLLPLKYKTTTWVGLRSSFVRNPRCRAFTLIELLVVISIIGVLVALGVAAYQKAVESSQSTKCMSKLRFTATAFNLFVAEQGKIPQAADYTTGFTGKTFWFTDLWPYLGRNDPFPQINDRKDHPLRCSSGKQNGWPYIGYGINGYMLPLGVDRVSYLAVAHPSKTFLLADSRNWIIAGWDGGLAKEWDFPHNKTANVLMFDGHIEKIKRSQLDDKDFEKKLKGLAD